MDTVQNHCKTLYELSDKYAGLAEEHVAKKFSCEELSNHIEISELFLDGYYIQRFENPLGAFFGFILATLFSCVITGLSVTSESAFFGIIGVSGCIAFSLLFCKAFQEISIGKTNKKLKEIAAPINAVASKALQTKREDPTLEIEAVNGLFYKLCKEAGITSLDNDFARKKAIKILKKLTGSDSPNAEQKYSKYIDYCFKRSIELGKIETKRKQKEYADWKTVPHKAELSEENALKIEQADEISKLTGIKKRQYILEQNRLDLDEKIENMRQGEEAMRVFQGALVNASQEKKSDWAFLAGIADGIAGPGAGAAVATDIMIENEKIEMRNRQRREGISKTVNLLHQGIWDSGAKRHELEAARALLEEESDDLVNKVVLDNYTTQELFDQLSFYWCGVSSQEDNSLLVELKYTNKMQIDLPKEASVTIDGTFITEIYCGKTLVGQCYATLPLYGIPKDQTTTAIGICPMYMGGDPDYHVEIKPHRLWLMEL